MWAFQTPFTSFLIISELATDLLTKFSDKLRSSSIKGVPTFRPLHRAHARFSCGASSAWAFASSSDSGEALGRLLRCDAALSVTLPLLPGERLGRLVFWAPALSLSPSGADVAKLKLRFEDEGGEVRGSESGEETND